MTYEPRVVTLRDFPIYVVVLHKKKTLLELGIVPPFVSNSSICGGRFSK